MSDWGISDYYDSSFGSIGFWTQAPAPVPRYDEERVEYHHAGGNDNTIILLGRKAPTLELTVACAAAEYDDLVAAQGSSETLTYPGLSGTTARLLTVQGQVHPHFTGIYSVQLSFIL